MIGAFDVVHVDADLVRAPGRKFAFDQRRETEIFQARDNA